MTKKQQLITLWITIPLALMMIVLVVRDIYNRQIISVVEKDRQEDVVLEETVDSDAEVIRVSPGREAVPGGSFVPEPDSVLSEQERETIAIPVRSAPTSPGSSSDSQSRSFVFNLEDDNIINNKEGGKNINVYVGDNVSMQFTAVDKDYNIAIPDYFSREMIISQGETETVRFEVRGVGSSIYYCPVCGGQDSVASGYIIAHER